jgi:hypothetical protein
VSSPAIALADNKPDNAFDPTGVRSRSITVTLQENVSDGPKT